MLRDDLTDAITAADPPAHWVVLDLESVSDVDSTATETLLELAEDLHARGIGLALARLKGPVSDYLERAGLFDIVGRDRIYLEVDDAVAALRTDTLQTLGNGSSSGGAGRRSTSSEEGGA